jgi:hypothetical protein
MSNGLEKFFKILADTLSYTSWLKLPGVAQSNTDFPGRNQQSVRMILIPLNVTYEQHQR